MFSRPKFLKLARSISKSIGWSAIDLLPRPASPQLLNKEVDFVWFCWLSCSKAAMILAISGLDWARTSAIFAGFWGSTSCFCTICSSGSVLLSLVSGVFLLFTRPSVANSSWACRRRLVAWLSSFRKSSSPPTLAACPFLDASVSWPAWIWLRWCFGCAALAIDIRSP